MASCTLIRALPPLPLLPPSPRCRTAGLPSNSAWLPQASFPSGSVRRMRRPNSLRLRCLANLTPGDTPRLAANLAGDRWPVVGLVPDLGIAGCADIPPRPPPPFRSRFTRCKSPKSPANSAAILPPLPGKLLLLYRFRPILCRRPGVNWMARLPLSPAPPAALAVLSPFVLPWKGPASLPAISTTPA